jgi:glycosyltransferase involved in cell wall biosynthesis
MVSRFAANISFGLTSGLRVLFGEKPDVIYTQSWPIFANGIIALVAKCRGIPLVLRVQDMYPESLESQQRVTRRNWIFRIIRKMDQMIANSSRFVLPISQVFGQLYENDRKIPVEKVEVIPNWGDDNIVVTDRLTTLGFRRKLGIPDDAFVAVYAGNLGIASSVETLVECGARLQQQGDIYIVIAGEGSQLDVCRELVAKYGLDRVIIHSPWRKEETDPLLQMADILLLPTKASQSVVSAPSKLISYFKAARPVVAAVLPQSDTAMALNESGAGWVAMPESIDQFARAITAASQKSTEALNRMGIAGRTYGIEKYSKRSNLPRIIRALETAGGLGSELPTRRQEPVANF